MSKSREPYRFRPAIEPLENREMLNANPLLSGDLIQTEQNSLATEVSDTLNTNNEQQNISQTEIDVYSLETHDLLAYQLELAKERTDAEAIVESTLKAIEDSTNSISDLEKSIADLEGKIEKGQEPGSVSFWARPFSRRVYMNYKNIPEGTLVQVANRGRVYMSMEVNTNATRMIFNIPRVPGLWAYPNMQLFHPDHGVLEESKQTFGTSHGNPYRGIRAAWHTLSIGEGADKETLEKELALLQIQFEELTAHSENQNDKLETHNASLHEAQEDLRESIPYSSMFVNNTVGSAGNSIPIRYRTNLDEVTFRIKDGTNTWQRVMKHVGGEADSRVHLDVAEIHMGNQMYDKGKGYQLEMLDHDENLLDQVTVLGSGRVASDQSEWEDLETGLIKRHPIVPDIQIASINGTAIVAAASTPYDDVRLQIEGGGIMSNRVIENDDGTELVMAQLFFNGKANSSGHYNVYLSNPKGIVLDTVTMKWDGENLSLTEADDRWNAEPQVIGMMTRGSHSVMELAEDVTQATGTVNVFASQTDLKTLNMDDYPKLREFQENELTRLSKFDVSREELDEAYFAKYPDMRDLTNDQMIRMRNDALGALWNCAHVYKGAVGRILKQAVDVYFVSQRGGDQQEALEKVENEILIWSGHRKIAELQIETGIKLPTASEALSEALRIYEQNTGAFYLMQDFKSRDSDQQEFQSLSRYWQIVHAGQPDGPISEVAINDGTLVASTDGAFEVESVNVNNSDVPRRVARVYRKIAELDKQAESGGYVDPRFKQWREVRDNENIQRERWQEKIEEVFRLVGSDSEDQVLDTTMVEEDPLRPSVAWATEQVAALDAAVDVAVEGVRTDERLRFGKKLSQLVRDNPDWLIQDAHNEESEKEVLHSFIVSRPLENDPFKMFGNHMFIASNARYLGDPNATIYGFGKGDNGLLIRLTGDDLQPDIDAWLSLKDNSDDEVDARLIPANNNVVNHLALSVIENNDYWILGTNCISVVKAIADASTYHPIVLPGYKGNIFDSIGSNQSDEIQFYDSQK